MGDIHIYEVISTAVYYIYSYPGLSATGEQIKSGLCSFDKSEFTWYSRQCVCVHTRAHTDPCLPAQFVQTIQKTVNLNLSN